MTPKNNTFNLNNLNKLVVPAALFVIFVIIYSITAYPGPGGRVNYNDSAWKMLLPTSGKVIPHVTGFPLYIFITNIFNIIMPFDALWARIVAISIFFGALTVMLVYMIAYSLSSHKIGSILAALTMGFSFTFWTQATEAEIYSLNAFFTVMVAYLFIKFHQTRATKYLLWGNLVYALSFGNHLTMVWMLPPLAYLVYQTDKKIFFDKKIIGMTLFFIFLGMVPYFFLYLRFCNVNQPSVNHFLGFVTGGAWKGIAMFIYNMFDVFQHRMALFLTLLNRQFFLPGILASLLGIALALFTGKHKIPLLFLTSIVVFQLFFCLNYGIHDIEVYFIPVYAILALFTALLFVDQRNFKTKIALVGLVIFLQLIFNLGREGIRVNKNKPLENMLFLVEHTPPGSLILIPQSFEKNGDYKVLARYITYTGEYGNYKVIYQEEDTRIPYAIIQKNGQEEYYLTSRLERLLKKVKTQSKDCFYFIGSKNTRQLKRNKLVTEQFVIKGKQYGSNRWMGLAIRKSLQ